MIGKYPLLEKVGEGYLGPVYRSFDSEIGRSIVVRILCDGIKWDAQLEELFSHECRAASALRHSNIATVFEIGKEEQSHYIVMESLAGDDLRTLCAAKPDMPVEAKLSIMIQVAEGLHYAHKNGILHRSLEPGKIHLTLDGVKIRDFAISGILMKHLPRPGVRWGAPIYLSPEQIQHQSGNVQSDIFSAGVIFYELLTYCHPFHDPDGNKALDNILLASQIATFDRFPEIPPGFWAIIRNCLAKNPNDRYANVDDLLIACNDLKKDLAEDIQLMLAELHSSLAPLRKAAAQPEAPEAAVKLLQAMESLLQGRKEADYITLDRLINDLIEQHPVIQNAADIMQPWESMVHQFPAFATEIDSAPGKQPVKDADVQTPERPAPPMPNPEVPIKPEEPIEQQQAAQVQVQVENKPVCKQDPAVKKTAFIDQQPEQAPSPWSNDSVARPMKKSRHGKNSNAWRKMTAPSYRTIAALLSLLLIMTAIYIVCSTNAGKSIRNTWGIFTANFYKTVNAADSSRTSPSSKEQGWKQNTPRPPANVNPAPEADFGSPVKTDPEPERRPVSLSGSRDQKKIAQISYLIDSGNLSAAKRELDKYQIAHSGNSALSLLFRKWQRASQVQEQELIAAKKQKETDWIHQVTNLFQSGKYNESGNTLNRWISEDPGNPRARELAEKNEEVQLALRDYSSAITENRYREALVALARAEKINPGDPTFSELRLQTESRRAAARGSLTIRRLGAQANILIDKRPVGKNGEVSNESITIGSHTISIENEGNSLVSRALEFNEGEQLAFVYDAAGRTLRPMIDSDLELLARRKLTEEVHHFESDHEHGLLRGSCHGVLLLSYLDIAYKPSSGGHGFRIPLKLLKLKVNGKSIEFSFISDGSRFHSFKFPDAQAAEKFKKKWDELRSKEL